MTHSLQRLIAVDIGVSGAVAVVDRGGRRRVEVHPIPWVYVKDNSEARSYDVPGILLLLGDLVIPGKTMAVLEEARPLPMTTAKKQRSGTKANFLKGLGFGIFLAYFTALDVPIEVVNPKKWQGALLPGVSGRDSLKQASVSLAEHLFPDSAQEFRGPRGGLNSDVADAANLAVYGRMRFMRDTESLANVANVASNRAAGHQPNRPSVHVSPPGRGRPVHRGGAEASTEDPVRQVVGSGAVPAPRTRTLFAVDP